jgi:hypothetical protein
MLMKLDTPATRKPDRSQVFAVGRYSRGLFLSRLRDEIAVLGVLGFDRHAIAHALGILEDDVLALSPKARKTVMRHDLTRRAVNALLHGRHAHLGGRTAGSRAKRLIEIASAYTREELIMEPGVGSVTATEIQLWLEKRGYALRPTMAPCPPSYQGVFDVRSAQGQPGESCHDTAHQP